MACSSKSVKFMKIISLILDTGTVALSYRLKHEVKNAGLNFSQFLIANRHRLFHLYERRNCCECRSAQNRSKVFSKYQWETLFKVNHSVKVCNRKNPCVCQYEPQISVVEDELDLSILCAILQNVCSLKSAELQDVKNIREKRNTFLHTKAASIEEDVYLKEFSSIRSTIESIAFHCGQEVFDKVKDEIENISKSELNDNMCRHVFSLLFHIKETTDEQLGSILQEIQEIKKFITRESPDNKTTGQLKDISKDLGDIKTHTTFQHASSDNEVYDNIENRSSIQTMEVLECGSSGTSVVHNGEYGMSFKRKITEDTINEEKKRLKSQGCIQIEKSNTVTSQQLETKNKENCKSEKNIVQGVHSSKNKVGSFINPFCLARNLEMTKCILREYPDSIFSVDENGWNASHFVAQRGNIHILHLLAGKGATLTETTYDHQTILHIACSNNKYTICQHILSQYPDMLNTVTTQGWNAAHFAAQGGDVRILQLLADKGTSLTKTTYDRKTILHIACMFSRFEMCNHILSQYPNMQNVVDKFGWNAAHFAAQEGDVRILRLLSDKGVPITEITFDHLTILHIACKHAKYEMCQHILSKSPELLNLLSTRGWTAAHYAAEGGDIRILQLLSDKGVPVTETTYDNRTILHNACACAKYEMCEYILSQYPDMPNVVSTLGWTAAHCATQGGDVRFLQLLADKGVPLTGATYANQTILHFACSNAKYEMCQHILSQYPYILNVVDRYGWNAAHFAAQGGDVRILQLLADKGVPVTETTYDNGTILHNACACAKYEMCEYILSKYHDMPNVVSTLGWTAAHCAAQGGDVRILQLLSDKGVPVTETTYGNSTILHIACCNAKYEMCEYILSQYPDILNAVNTRGWNAAHYAAQGGDIRILQLLSDKGVPLTGATYDNKTILHIACRHAKYAMCQHILSQYPDILNVVDTYGWNAAHFAAQGGDIRILQLLSDKGVPNIETTYDNSTILHIACMFAKYEMCQHILSKSPELQNLLNTRGWNAAHCAAQGGDIRILQLLSDKGVPLTGATYDNKTILHIACRHAKYAMCQHILSKYPDILNVVDTYGWNAAHFAAQGGDIRILQLLSDKGVPNIETTYDNSTILHIACMFAKYEMCQHILSKSPELQNLLNARGWTAAHYAAEGGDIRILQLLSDKGVPVTETTYDNLSILHLACFYAKYKFCEYTLSQYPDMLNVVNTLGYNAAHCAAQGGDIRILQLLADKGVPLTGATYENETILHIACAHAKYAMCQQILSQYPEILNDVTKQGLNAAHCAAQGGDVRILNLLADKGVPLTGTTYDNGTILHFACCNAKYEMCQYILSHHSNMLDDVNTQGWNAAHCAAQGGDVRILQLLSDKGVPITETTFDHLTILHIACSSAKYEMCQHILSQYPNLIHSMDITGKNAAHFAIQGGNTRILQLLTQKGVRLNACSENE